MPEETIGQAVTNLVVVLGGIAIGALVYFIPGIVAWRSKHRNETAIWVLNLFLGWTLLGWVIALIWATTKPAAPQLPPTAS